MILKKDILFTLLITTVLFSGLLVGCRSLVFGKNGLGDHWMDKAENNTPVLADRTCGSEVVWNGDNTRIQLKSDPAIDYVWRLAKPSVLFDLVRKDSESTRDAHIQFFTFNAKQIGEETLRFKYVRIGEKDVAPLNVQECRVTVVE